MPHARSEKAFTLLGVAALVATLGVMAGRTRAPKPEFDEMRDAVAAPVSPALLGARPQPNPGWFASPATRRAEAESALLASRRMTLSRALHSRAAKLRREAK